MAQCPSWRQGSAPPVVAGAARDELRGRPRATSIPVPSGRPAVSSSSEVSMSACGAQKSGCTSRRWRTRAPGFGHPSGLAVVRFQDGKCGEGDEALRASTAGGRSETSTGAGKRAPAGCAAARDEELSAAALNAASRPSASPTASGFASAGHRGRDGRLPGEVCAGDDKLRGAEAKSARSRQHRPVTRLRSAEAGGGGRFARPPQLSSSSSTCRRLAARPSACGTTSDPLLRRRTRRPRRTGPGST